jgi:histidinol phosphatase-like enzyme (inositol monophosphatase family)
MASSLTKPQLKKFLTAARWAARLGGARALRYFQKRVPVIKKVDRSPVTRADREAEQVIRLFLGRKFPGHQLCGEEFGWNKNLKPDFRWWIDPVDGTRQFVRGIPFWGTLIALEHQGEVVAGVIHHPAIQTTLWAAKGLGCYVNGRRARVSRIPRLAEGTFSFGSVRLVPRAVRKKFTDLIARAYDDRGFGDCFGHSMVIQGMVEAVADPVVKPYDVAPIKICVEEAGGKFTDWKGRATIRGGSALSSNGLVHEEILKALK